MRVIDALFVLTGGAIAGFGTGSAANCLMTQALGDGCETTAIWGVVAGLGFGLVAMGRAIRR